MTRDEVLEFVCDIYRDYKISEFGFDLFKLCNNMSIDLIAYSSYKNKRDLLLKASEDAICGYNNIANKYVIIYNDEIIPEGRLKFTIPHELGHIVLNHQFCYDYDFYKEGDANLFSNELYIPQAFMIYYKLDTVDKLMTSFGITKSYAQILLSKLRGRHSKELTKVELKLINIFEKNKQNFN